MNRLAIIGGPVVCRIGAQCLRRKATHTAAAA